ncbi:MAG: hypothetical protein ACFE0I_25500 [Elainellaceae cyanobacterium]
MPLLTSIVDLESIQVKDSPFDPTQNSAQIEALANTIKDLRGLINLPVVKQVGIDDYEIISGHLEYYAYLKARESDSSLLDRISVFIADSKNQLDIQRQLEVQRKINNIKEGYKGLPVDEIPKQVEIELRVRNLEHSISKVHGNNQPVIDAIEGMKAELLEVIETRLPRPIHPLDAFNQISEPAVAFQVQRKLEFLGASTAKKVVAKLQEACKDMDGQSFQSFSEVLDALKVKQGERSRRLISEERMLAVIDRWNH